MEHGNLDGKMFLEEEQDRQRGNKGKEDIGWHVQRDMLGQPKEGWFEHLREVGKAGFVAAVEHEAHGVWMVIYLYKSVGAIVRFDGMRLICAFGSRWTGVMHWTICY